MFMEIRTESESDLDLESWVWFTLHAGGEMYPLPAWRYRADQGSAIVDEGWLTVDPWSQQMAWVERT